MEFGTLVFFFVMSLCPFLASPLSLSHLIRPSARPQIWPLVPLAAQSCIYRTRRVLQVRSGRKWTAHRSSGLRCGTLADWVFSFLRRCEFPRPSASPYGRPALARSKQPRRTHPSNEKGRSDRSIVIYKQLPSLGHTEHKHEHSKT